MESLCGRTSGQHLLPATKSLDSIELAPEESREGSSSRFDVRRNLAELHRLELTPKSVRIIDSMEKTCRQLKADVLTILIPKTLAGDSELAPS